MSSLRYLTSLSDIIPLIKQRRTGWVQLPALIGGKQNVHVYILNSKIGKERKLARPNHREGKTVVNILNNRA